MEKALGNLETFFLALADKTRMRILNLMGDDEICVGHLVEVLGESQPKISRHLAYLKNAGLVAVRRDGKWMHYRIEEPENVFVAEALSGLLDWLGTQEQMKKERRKLEEIGGITKKSMKSKRTVSAPRLKEPLEIYEEETYDEVFEKELPTEPAPQPYQRQELETFLL